MMADKEKLKWIFGFGLKLALLTFTGALTSLMLIYMGIFRNLLGWVGVGLIALHYFIFIYEIVGAMIVTHAIFLIGGFIGWLIFGSIIGWIVFSIKNKMSMKLRGLIIGLLIPLSWLIGTFIPYLILRDTSDSIVDYLMASGFFFIIILPIGLIFGFLIGFYLEGKQKKNPGAEYVNK